MVPTVLMATGSEFEQVEPEKDRLVLYRSKDRLVLYRSKDRLVLYRSMRGCCFL